LVRWPRVRHRALQFVRALSGALYPVDMAYVGVWLGADQRGAALPELFASMPRAEQHHGVHICRVRLWERVLVVLVERFAPRLAAEWADVPADGIMPVGVRRGLVVSRHHPAWGADLAAQAGASPRTVAWIRQHHDPVDARDPLLMALQDADEA